MPDVQFHLCSDKVDSFGRQTARREPGTEEMDRRTSTRADLLEVVHASCPALSRSQAREIFEMALDEVAEALVRGESVKLRSFGLFAVRAKRERVGRNPRTGIEVPIKPRRVLTFKPSPVLLGQVNGQTGKAKIKRGV